MKIDGVLPKISNSLGSLSRTNSEALTGAIMKRSSTTDFSQGAAITSSFFPDEHTHVEPVRYGKGSNFMGLLQTLMSDGANPSARRKDWLRTVVRKPQHLIQIMNVRRWSERTVIALVMQNVDSSISVIGKKFLFFKYLTSKNDPTKPNATYISTANEVTRSIAREYEGIAAGHVGDLVNAPFTAHFVGGCVISDDPEKGVIDPYHRVWNYPRLHIVDGSAVTANLGVNPSLTITAQAERAFSIWPNAGQEDPRPQQGSSYQRIKPIAPAHPVVPADAPASYRIT
jgi:cholesterol oxidase